MRTLALVLASLAVAAPAAAQSPQPRASLPDIEDEVMCPICGTTLELSGAPQAERQRELIRRLIAQGLTKDQIKDELVAEYGEEVLAVPGDEGFDLAAWTLPIAGIAAALFLIALALLRARSRRQDEGPPPSPLPAEEAKRLEADLERYDV